MVSSEPYRSEHDISPILEAQVGEYFNQINFFERLYQEKLSLRDLKELLYDNLQQYFAGKISFDFLLIVGDEIGQGYGQTKDFSADDILGTIACEWGYLFEFDVIEQKKKIDKTLHWAFGVLQKDLFLQSD